MAITTRDQLAAALAGSYDRPFFKGSATAVSGFIYALFRASGGDPAASTLANPTTTGRALDRTSSGAIPLCATGSGNTLYLAGLQVAGPTIGNVGIYDRAVEWGGLSGTVTTAQSLSAVTLPTRCGDGTGYGIWLEIYTALGSTASATVTASYTNQAGTSGRTATLIGGIPASIPANRVMQFALQDGDTGVRSVQSVTSTTSTGTAGNFGVTIRKLIDTVPNATANVGYVKGYAETALAIIPSDACLEILVQASTTSTGTLFGKLSIAQG